MWYLPFVKMVILFYLWRCDTAQKASILIATEREETLRGASQKGGTLTAELHRVECHKGDGGGHKGATATTGRSKKGRMTKRHPWSVMGPLGASCSYLGLFFACTPHFADNFLNSSPFRRTPNPYWAVGVGGGVKNASESEFWGISGKYSTF